MAEIPSGAILLWFGAVSNIPQGYVLCDGRNNTPNLVSRFVYGAGSKSADPQPGSTGGQISHTHVATSTVSVQSAGNHTHGLPQDWFANTASSGSGIHVVDRRNTSPPWNTTNSGAHSHPATCSTTLQQASNIPPYVALCYIMKV